MVERREVVLARVFFSDTPESKVRPAIILSDGRYNTGGSVLVAAVTTAGDEYCMEMNAEDANCPLAEGSGARFDGIIKMRSEQVARKIGKITPKFHARLVEKIVGMIK